MRRRALYSGSWYPAEPERLKEYVRTDGEGDLKGAVLPHSGLFYSGDLISRFFTSLSPDVRRVLIISPSHYYYLEPDTFYTASFTSSSTPLGDVETTPLDFGVRADRAIEREHGIEMFLPFLARKGLSVSYALLSSVTSEKKAEELAETALSSITPGTALIASSDFTHYGPGYHYTPFGIKDAAGKVDAYDRRAAEFIAESNVTALFKEYNGKSTICGLAPAIVASLALSTLEGRPGEHYTSADKGGGSGDFVDYRTVFWS